MTPTPGARAGGRRPGPRGPDPAPVAINGPSPAGPPGQAAPTRYRAPPSWRLGYIWHQLIVLLMVGPAFLFATLDSPVFMAAFAHLPHLVIPPGLFVRPAFYVPLLAPFLLGLPLVVTRHRTPLLLWLAVITIALLVSVAEVSRLNWFTFFSGVAFRPVDSGPVPMTRTIAGLITLLLGLLLLAQQSVRVAVIHLAERGVAVTDLRRVKRGLIGLERGLLLLAIGAGTVLTVVASISLSVTEGAPETRDGLAGPLLWSVLLVVALLLALGIGLWDVRGRRSG